MRIEIKEKIKLSRYFDKTFQAFLLVYIVISFLLLGMFYLAYIMPLPDGSLDPAVITMLKGWFVIPGVLICLVSAQVYSISEILRIDLKHKCEVCGEKEYYSSMLPTTEDSETITSRVCKKHKKPWKKTFKEKAK